MSTQGVRYRTRQPLAFRLLVHYCALPAPLARCFWTALQRSTWQTPLSFRRSLLLHESQRRCPGDTVVFMTEVMTPGAVTEVIECLVREKRVTRRQGNQITEAVLAQVDASGNWK